MSVSMKKLFLVVASSLLFLTGCDREDLIVWSPDGKRVVVLANDGLRMGDESGKLSAPVDSCIKIVRWLPDSHHALVVVSSVVTEWNELRSLLSQSDQRNVILLANKIWKSGHLPRSADYMEGKEAFLYLNKLYGKRAVQVKFRLDPNYLSVAVDYLQAVDFSSDGKMVEGAILLRLVNEIDDMRISPNGKLVALTTTVLRKELGSVGVSQTIVLATRGGPAKIVAAPVSALPDWSVDGKSLVYILCPIMDAPGKNLEARMWVSKLVRRTVADENSTLLSKFGPEEKMVELVDISSAQARCLPDGGVIFNAKMRSFPSVAAENTKEYLYRLNPDHSLETLASSDELPDKLHLFEPNQDGTKIVFSGYGRGEIAVLDVSSRKVINLENAGPRELKFLPMWRTRDVLCYPARTLNKTGNEHDVDVVLQSMSDGSRGTLSKDWSVKSVQFLNDPKKKEEPKKTEDNIVRRQPRAVKGPPRKH
jgi:hypothetical protein